MNENVTHGPELTGFMHLNSEALAAQSQAEPHTLIGTQRKPTN